ncbi:LuxR C-terminal-related transcriptional regulator [Ornithinimicrobium sp. Y1694]|uniref:response regulator transcription factor n=1 Tax=Ornithinimicrobium sp. Y1694 TaxID=3418590 RepID=UPI003CF3CDCC
MAIADDYPVDVIGLTTMLHPYADRVVITPFSLRAGLHERVDLTLVDTYGTPDLENPALVRLLGDERAGQVVLYCTTISPQVRVRAARRGFAACIDKAISAEELVRVAEDLAGEAPFTTTSVQLTSRETEVLALIAHGLSNQEICARTYLTINTIKSYIRTGYAKIGVTRRAEAVAWAFRNGLGPRPRSSSA